MLYEPVTSLRQVNQSHESGETSSPSNLEIRHFYRMAISFIELGNSSNWAIISHATKAASFTSRFTLPRVIRQLNQKPGAKAAKLICD